MISLPAPTGTQLEQYVAHPYQDQLTPIHTVCPEDMYTSKISELEHLVTKE